MALRTIRVEGDPVPVSYTHLNNDQEKFDKSCRLMMTSMLSEAAKIFERLPILLHADIIRNVLYLSLIHI